MNYLAIDTSTNICSVAFLYKSKLNVLNEFNVKEHSKYLPIMSKELVEDNIKEIDFIALSIGPGSYSGLKIGCSFAKGLAFSIEKPIVPVLTFEGINAQIKNKNKYFISLYSHKDFSFFQLFDSGISKGEAVCDNISNMKDYKIYGYGFSNKFNMSKYQKIIPSAEYIGSIAVKKYNELVEEKIDNVGPIYLSSKVRK